MSVPFDKFVRATGELDKANRILEHKAALIIENFGWPTHVKMGRDWLRDSMFKQEPVAFWFGSWGIKTTIEIVDGDILEVV